MEFASWFFREMPLLTGQATPENQLLLQQLDEKRTSEILVLDKNG
jgi:hypothetical protein